MLNLEFAQPRLELRHLRPEHFGATDLPLVVVLALHVPVCFDALAAHGSLAVAFLAWREISCQSTHETRWTLTILRFLQQRHALPRCNGLGFMGSSRPGGGSHGVYEPARKGRRGEEDQVQIRAAVIWVS